MPRFAANLTMLFNELPFLDRFEAAAKAGFKAVEFLFPYPYAVADLKDRLSANGLTLVLHNLPAGNWDAGERGIACLPDRAGEFREGVARAIEYGSALGVPQLNCLAGKAPAGMADAVLHETFVGNLRFYLNRTAQAIALIDEVGSDNLFVQYDIYHAQRMEGELVATMQKHLARIAHIQLADNPGRNEPGTGEIHYGNVFKALDRMGYTGWIGCEYKPATTTEAGLGWLKNV
jgi:hydroxypyruvate isomerase